MDHKNQEEEEKTEARVFKINPPTNKRNRKISMSNPNHHQNQTKHTMNHS
jgi:hypothetical protein